MPKKRTFAEFIQSMSKNDLAWAMLDAFREGHLSARSGIVSDFLGAEAPCFESVDRNFPLEELMHGFGRTVVVSSEAGKLRQIAMPEVAMDLDFMMRDFMSPNEKVLEVVKFHQPLPTAYLAVRKPYSFAQSMSKHNGVREHKPAPVPEATMTDLDKAMLGQVSEPTPRQYSGNYISKSTVDYDNSRRMSDEEYKEFFGHGQGSWGGG